MLFRVGQTNSRYGRPHCAGALSPLDPAWVYVSADKRNAFNAVKRKRVRVVNYFLREDDSTLRSFVRYLMHLLRNKSRVVIGSGGKQRLGPFLSEEGVQPGGASGSAGYAAAIQGQAEEVDSALAAAAGFLRLGADDGMLAG